MAIKPGQSLSHYELVEKIGEGGMGVVWKAIDTTLDRPVAIKLLPHDFANDPDRLARFEREAKLLAALNHTHIASIYSVHHAEGEHFIALELVEGEDLATRTAAGPLPIEDSLQVCLEIAQALETAHQAGVVHRDLKPANVKLCADGKAKVLDFGLAKAIDAQTSSDGKSPTFAPTATSMGTQAGVLLGTAAYMSPEQARGKPLDHRTDLWSFGCVLYECLTGRVLFAGETVSDTLAAILRKDPDWSRLPSETPAGVRSLLKRCLARDVSRRLHSASDARIELLEAIEHPHGDLSPASTETATRRFRWSWVALALIAGAALGGALGSLWRGQPTPTAPVMRLSVPVQPELRMQHPRLTPDGGAIVFRAIDHSEPLRGYQLFVRRLDRDELSRIEGSEDVRTFALSPDGSNVAFVVHDEGGSKRRLMRAPLDQSAPPLHLADYDQQLLDILWLDDGAIVAFGPDEALWRFPAGGGPGEKALEVHGEPSPNGLQARGTLPGSRILVRGVTFETGDYQQYVGTVDLETGELKRIVPDGSWPVYLDSGQLVYSRGDQLLLAPFDAGRSEVTGPARVILGGAWAAGGFTGAQFGVSKNGHLVYGVGGVQGSQRQLVYADDQAVLGPWSDARHQFTTIHIAPSGERIAVGVDNTAEGDALLQVRVSESSNPHLKTIGTEPGFDCAYPVWSTDSRRLAYPCWGQDTGRIYVADALGHRKPTLALERPVRENLEMVGFVRDDTELLATRMTDSGSREVLRFPADGGAPGAEPEIVFLDDPNIERMAASLDGRWVLYFSRPAGRRELFFRRIREDGSFGPRLALGLETGDWAYWSTVRKEGPERYEVLFEKDRRASAVTVRLAPSFEVGAPVRIGLEDTSEAILFMDRFPDGRFLGIRQPDSELGAPGLRLILNWNVNLRTETRY